MSWQVFVDLDLGKKIFDQKSCELGNGVGYPWWEASGGLGPLRPWSSVFERPLGPSVPQNAKYRGIKVWWKGSACRLELPYGW